MPIRSAVRNAVRDVFKSEKHPAVAVLSKFGTNAHAWIPGIGYFNGLQAGNYIDSAGTQAGLVDNPVGLVMDAKGSLGAELSSLFSSNVTATTYGSSVAGAAIGKVYLISATVVKTSGTSIDVGITNSALGWHSVDARRIITANGTTQIYFYTVSTDSVVAPTAIFTASSGTVSAFSVREVTGAITATQGTTANKPILRRGAVNLLLRSEEFNTSWATTGTISVNAIAAPNATTTADLLTASATTFSGVTQQTFSGVASGATYTLSVFVKKNNWRYVGLRFNTSIFGATEQIPFYDFDTDTVSNGGVTAATITRTIIGDGWVRVAVTYTATTTGGGCQIWLTNSVGATQPAKSGTESVYIWGAQLELGSTASEYIPTTTAAASSSSGNYYWQFDGSNDSLALSSVPFQMADDHCVVAGVRQGTNVSAAWSINSSTDVVPYIARIRRGTANTLTIDWRSDAAVNIAHSVALTDNSIGVVSARNIAGTKIGRLNGVQFGTSSTAQGATTVNGATIGAYISATTTYWNGSIFPVIAIKGTVSDADLLILERWVGQMSGVSI